MAETREHRLKRLNMRAWRRGMKEMDLILGPFADQHLAGMNDVELAQFDQLLNENDQEIYTWITQQIPPAVGLDSLLDRIKQHFKNP